MFGERNSFKLYGSTPAIFISTIGFVSMAVYVFFLIIATINKEKDNYEDITYSNDIEAH